MKKPEGDKLTEDTAYQWIAYAARVSVEDVRMVVPPDAALQMGVWLSGNPLLNPPRPRAAPQKLGVFECRYCGQKFIRVYRTRHHHYCSEYHRQLYWRERRKG